MERSIRSKWRGRSLKDLIEGTTRKQHHYLNITLLCTAVMPCSVTHQASPHHLSSSLTISKQKQKLPLTIEDYKNNS